MVAPTITTLTPAVGLTRGETFVSIVGTDFNDEASLGTVAVFFDNVEASEVGVVSSTRLICLTPRSTRVEPAAVDVRVENVPAAGPVEPTTAVDAFTYHRPKIETLRDHSTDDPVLIVNRQLVSDLRRFVLANIHHDMHSEYVDALSAAAQEEVQASAPHLKLLGPNIQEDPFYAVRDKQNTQISPVPGTFERFGPPITVKLTYSYVGVGRTKGETLNLWGALTDWIKNTPFLEVPVDGVDKANGIVEFELAAIWEDRADIRSQSTREAVFQFSGSMVIRGVHTSLNKIGEGADTLDVPTIDPIEQIP